MFNLVIKMEEGKIYEMVWDNGCFDCEEKNCIKDLISKSVFYPLINQTYESCREYKLKEEGEESTLSEELKNKLQPKFYITWFGTDKDKRQLKTAGLAMTKFKPYIYSGSFYSAIKGLF